MNYRDVIGQDVPVSQDRVHHYCEPIVKAVDTRCVCLSACLCLCACMCDSVYLFLCLYIYVYICVTLCMCVGVCVYLCMGVHTCVHVCGDMVYRRKDIIYMLPWLLCTPIKVLFSNGLCYW